MKSQLWAYISNLSPVAKSVLAVLLVFSLFTWVVIFYKTIQLLLLRREDESAIKLIKESIKRGKPPASSQVFSGSSFLSVALRDLTSGSSLSSTADEMEGLIASSLALAREKYESFLVFLAIAGSSSPFIGLFGTVWGVMDAFKGLGKAGGSSLSMVSRGIADALVATACGLFVAIPAVIFYNLFQHIIKKWERRAGSYLLELLYRLKDGEGKAS